MNIQQRIWAQKAGLYESKKVEDETVEEGMHGKKKKKWEDSTVEEELSPEQAAFRKLFDKMLKKHGVESPNELPDDKKDDFFNEVALEWGKDPANKPEKDEEVKEATMPMGVVGSGAGLGTATTMSNLRRSAGPGGAGGEDQPTLQNPIRATGLSIQGLLSAYGTDNPQYDFNGDGIVDGADLGYFLANYGG